MENILQQILQEIQLVRQDMQQLQQNQLKLEQNQQQLQQNQLNLEQSQKEMSFQINSIYQSVVRIEDGQPQDIYAILQSIHNKIIDKESEISALNKRIFRLESAFERMS